MGAQGATFQMLRKSLSWNRILPHTYLKEGVTRSLVSGNPPHMSYRWNQLCEMRSTVLISKKSAVVGFWRFFSNTQVVPCVNDRKSRFCDGRGGPKIFEKKIFNNIFVTLGTKTVQKNAKIWGFPAIRDRVTPSLKTVSVRLDHRRAR